MRAKFLLSAAALVATAAFPVAASAAATAEATTALNIRSGPGPQYDVIGVIDENDHAAIMGCIRGSLWCQVAYHGKQGWAYSKYLAMDQSSRTVVIAEHERDLDIPSVTYEGAPAAGAAGGAVTGAVTGALIGGPVGAAVGATVGAAAGATAAVVTPPPKIHTYISAHQVEPVYLNGEVVVGAGVPQNVKLYPVPDYQYEYAYVNRVPVLVSPQSRRIVYIYR